MTNKESYRELEEIQRKKVLENTFCYLEKYLNPDRNWAKEIAPKQRIYRIRFANVNWETVSDHIKGMEYQDFLKTPYWRAIAAHTKYKAGYRCQLCNSSYNLVTHHRDYRIHGSEHAHMQELTVICDDCHTKFHDRFPERNLRVHDPFLKRNLSMYDPFLKRKLKTLAIFTILSAFVVYFSFQFSIFVPQEFYQNISIDKISKSDEKFFKKW